MTKAKLFETELYMTSDMRRTQKFRTLWLPEAEIQAHVYNDRWIVKRCPIPVNPVGEVKDTEVSDAWASAIEVLMAVEEAREAANTAAMQILDMV